MKNFKLVLVSLFLSSLSFAQVQVCLGTDVTVCQGQTVQITNCGGAGGSPAGGIYLNAPTNLSLTDDSWSPVVNMGFNFNFYGSNFNQMLIGSNGIVTFNLGSASGYCPWSLGATTLPSTSGLTHCFNSAMVAHQDLNPSNATSGPIQYQMLGTAPNRMFVILYNGVTMFSCTSSCSYIGYIFYETTNIVEMFIGEKGSCPSWNGGQAIQGTENNGGTVGHITPGRNNTVWTANQDGRRWTPTSPSNTNNYAITTIPYVNINAPGGNLQWQNNLGQTFPYNNGVLNINQVPPGVTGYWLTGTSCGVGIGSVSDTTWITRTSVNASATATTDYCSGGSGTATANPLLGTPPFSYLWTPGGQTTQTATNLVAGNYQVLVTDANGCTKTVNIVVPNSGATYSGSTTVVSCPGGADGTATATMTPSLGTVSYNWYDAGGQTTQTATGLSAGTYHCEVSSSVGCIDTVEVIITEIPPMVAQSVGQDVSCNSGSDGVVAVNVVGGTGPYSYAWDNSSSTAQAANDLSAGTHTVTITDANNCVITSTTTIGEPAPLSITSLTPDQTICPENSTMLTATGSGGSSPYTFTWTENGVVIGTGTSIEVDPTATNAVYCVTLSEACGSPTTNDCMNIVFPTAIVPMFVPDKTWSCEPGLFTFTNTSNNPNEIQSVLFEFGDGNEEILVGAAGVTHEYNIPNPYDVDVTVTSIYGCVYTGHFEDIVSVIANPIADFNMSANPTTIFETTVTMQDKSSAGVVSWQWSSPGSVPSTSTFDSPTFQFPDGIVDKYVIQLIVQTPEGCVDTVERILSVNSDILFFAPNSFTPDDDEFNQTWEFSISGIDVYNFELIIFDRWGEAIWETHDPSASWDGTYNGKILPAGTYTWVARVKDIYSDDKKTFNGFIYMNR
ncbi:MAG: gliding motility-associated C-terminal domain-containing protein [Bacteroidota bacterium]